jgi:hypothetical protein
VLVGSKVRLAQERTKHINAGSPCPTPCMRAEDRLSQHLGSFSRRFRSKRSVLSDTEARSRPCEAGMRETPEALMTLTVLDPRTGERVTHWIAPTPVVQQPRAATILMHPRFAERRPR